MSSKSGLWILSKTISLSRSTQYTHCDGMWSSFDALCSCTVWLWRDSEWCRGLQYLQLFWRCLQILRARKEEHYFTATHQHALVDFLLHAWRRPSLSLPGKALKMDIDPPYAVPSTTFTISESTTVDLMSATLRTLSQDSQRLIDESTNLQNNMSALQDDCAKLKLSMEEQHAYLHDLQPNQQSLSNDLVTVRNTYEQSRNVSLDGSIIWKIENFKEKQGKLISNLGSFGWSLHDRSSSIWRDSWIHSCVNLRLFGSFSLCHHRWRSVRATIVDLLAPFLLVAHRLQDASSPLSQRRWQRTWHTHVRLLRAHAWRARRRPEVPIQLQGHLLSLRSDACEEAHRRLFSTGREIEQLSAPTVGHEHRQWHTEILCIGSVVTGE